MKIKIYQIDAFTDKIFSGNPAAICPLAQWLDDAILQKIAMENNLAETGFVVKENDSYQIRWFTPTVEVDLCGHATLAAAYVLFNHLKFSGDEILFHSRSGTLSVRRNNELFTLNFPGDIFESVELTPQLAAAFRIKPKEVYKGKTDYMFIFDNEAQINSLQPDFHAISNLKARGVIVTAKGNQVDFVSRFFAPQSGINEDPVTGSAHTTLIPYWSGLLNKKKLKAIQLSPRKGYLQCNYLGERVEIGGQARTYMTGEIEIE